MILAHAGHLASKGHRVSIMANAIDTLFAVDPRIRILPMSRKNTWGTLCTALFRRFDDQVVIVDIIVLTLLLAVRNRNRIVYFAQDDNVTYYRNAFPRIIMRLLYRCAFSVLRIPSVAVSDDLARKFYEAYSYRVDVAPNGIDVHKFRPKPSVDLIKSKHGKKAILVLARGDWRKGYDSVNKVVGELCNAPAAPLVVWTVGLPSNENMGGCSVRNFGYVHEADLSTIMSSADVFFYPTRHEGFGLMVAEAFACKCPVVTTDVVAIARHERNALTSPADDIGSMTHNIHRILYDAPLRSSLVEDAYAFAQELSLERGLKSFESYLAVYLQAGRLKTMTNTL